MGENICNTELTLGIKNSLCFPLFVKKEKEENIGVKTKSIELVSFEMNINKSKMKNERKDENHSMETRKKLRLTNEQSSLLERSFCSQNTLTSIQKEELAQKLGLRTRQVEVWFQNRRARTKLKQTEVDCDVLKKWCENLSDENKRLRREVNELRFYRSKFESNNKVCPSCEIGFTSEDEEEKARPLLQLCN